MDARFLVRLAVVSLVVLLAGCSSAAPGKPLQLRVVISSTDGPCSAPALESTGPGSACSTEGDATYELAKSLGTITPTSVDLPDDQAANASVTLHFSHADTETLGDASHESLNKRMAILLDGRVLSAPQVMATLTDSELTMSFGSAADAKKAAAELRATSAP